MTEPEPGDLIEPVDRVELSPLFKVCSYCSNPALGWFWSKEQGYTGWCKEHANRQSIEVNEESFRR